MKKLLIIALLIIGCVTEPEDCARVVGGNSYDDDYLKNETKINL